MFFLNSKEYCAYTRLLVRRERVDDNRNDKTLRHATYWALPWLTTLASCLSAHVFFLFVDACLSILAHHHLNSADPTQTMPAAGAGVIHNSSGDQGECRGGRHQG
jgi:hypothetical protein